MSGRQKGERPVVVIIDDPVKDIRPWSDRDAAILAWAEKHFHLDSPIITVRRLVEEEL